MDPIADTLVRIKNAQVAGHHAVKVKKSKASERLLSLLKKEGFIDSFDALNNPSNPQGELMVHLKYYGTGRPAMSLIKRVSKPGRRVYSKVTELPKVMSGLGIAIVSTSKGLMTDREARKRKVGGEVVALIG
jgi:small subunit ribosomal protein S8